MIVFATNYMTCSGFHLCIHIYTYNFYTHICVSDFYLSLSHLENKVIMSHLQIIKCWEWKFVFITSHFLAKILWKKWISVFWSNFNKLYMCVCVCVCVCVCILSCFSHVWFFATPWTVASQAALSLGFCPWDSVSEATDWSFTHSSHEWRQMGSKACL